MSTPSDLGSSVLAAWRTNARVTTHLIEHLPSEIWDERLPGASTRTVRMLAAHLHNSRAQWTRTLGQEHGIETPDLVDPRRVTRRQLMAALRRSSKGIESILRLGIDAGGRVPPSRRYVWRNLPLDVGHVLSYFVAHEGHHRGQLLLVARQLGHRVPARVANDLWQWAAWLRRDR